MRRLTFDNNVISSVFESEESFEGFKTLMFECGAGEFSEKNMTKSIANKMISAKLSEITGLESGKRYSKTEIRRAIRKMKADPIAFDLIEEVLDELLVWGWQSNPFFAEFVDRRDLSDGDKATFYVDDDTILSVDKVAGNHHDLRRQRLGVGESYTISTAWYGVKVYAEFERILTGAESWDRLVQKVYEAFDRYVLTMMYSAVSGAVTTMSATSLFHKTGTLTLANVNTLAGNVEKANPGTEVVVMGTKVALSKLYALAPADWISEDMKVALNTTGRIGMWNGYRIVEIQNGFTDKSMSATLVPDDQILFMPINADNKFVKFVDEGDGIVTEIADQADHLDMTYDFEYQRQIGVGVVLRRNFGVYDSIA